MARRPKGVAPAMRHHKASGRAYVEFQGRTHYLGPWQSAEARRAYRDWVDRWEAANQEELPAPRRGVAVTVADLVAHHERFAERHYVRLDGRPTTEPIHFRSSLALLVERFAHKDVETITGRDLRSIVDAWRLDRREDGTPRYNLKTINKQLGRMKRIFTWGARPENGLVSETTAARLALMRGLRMGEAPASAEVQPVPMSDLIRTLMHLDERQPMYSAMARVQFYCGARAGEVCALRTDEIHRERFTLRGRTVRVPPGLAIFAPTQHKTAHRQHDIYYTLGPQAQEALAPWLGGEWAFPGKVRAHVGEPYYSTVVGDASEAAGVPRWSPGQLRHNFLTRWDYLYGNEVGSAAVRHKHLSTTAVYVQRDLARVGAAALTSG